MLLAVAIDRGITRAKKKGAAPELPRNHPDQEDAEQGGMLHKG